MPVAASSSSESIPDLDGLSQQIADLHMQGDLFLDKKAVGKHIRRVTLAHVINAPGMGPPHHRLLIGGQETKFVELVANVADIQLLQDKNRIDFILDDGFARTRAWLAIKPNPTEICFKQQLDMIESLRLEPFAYAHIEAKVQYPIVGTHPSGLQVISMRRLQSGWDIWLHLLQTLAEIRDSDELANEESPDSPSPAPKRPLGPAEKLHTQERPLPQPSSSTHHDPRSFNVNEEAESGRAVPVLVQGDPKLVDPPAPRRRSVPLPEHTPIKPTKGKLPRPSPYPEPRLERSQHKLTEFTQRNTGSSSRTTRSAPPDPTTPTKAQSSQRNQTKDSQLEDQNATQDSPKSPPARPQQLKSPPPKRDRPGKSKTAGPSALALHPMTLGSHILRFFRFNFEAATSPEGISLDADPGLLEYLIYDLNLVDITPDDLREALHLLMQQGVMYAIDEIHYALCPGDMAPIGDLR